MTDWDNRLPEQRVRQIMGESESQDVALATRAELPQWELLNEGFDSTEPRPSKTLREVMSIGFRHSRLIVGVFLSVCLLTAGYIYFRTPDYEARMTILIKRDRVDQVVSTNEGLPAYWRNDVSEEELNSEAELLLSYKLLTQVVNAQALDRSKPASLWDALIGADSNNTTQDDAIKGDLTENAVERLRRSLVVQPRPKSNLIVVRYRNKDRSTAKEVLASLGDLYIARYLDTHRAQGAAAFYQSEAERYKQRLDSVSGELEQFRRQTGVVSLSIEKETTVRKAKDVEETLRQIRAEIASGGQRLEVLERAANETPQRMTTQVRMSAAAAERLQQQLAELELKRIELANVFQPDYPPVKEVDEKIAATRAAITATLEKPPIEETTDRDPTFDWIRSKLTEGRTELAGLRARESKTAQALDQLHGEAQRLASMEQRVADMEREMALTEQSYMVYSRKMEEARVSESLDRQRILNVAIADPPRVPPKPASLSRMWIGIGGVCAAFLLSLFAALVVDYLDPSFRTPSEVEGTLGLPVLASIPECDYAARGSNGIFLDARVMR